MKTILVATDLSARSDWAIERAAKLSLLHQARLIILNVVDDELPARLADRMRDEAKAYIDETQGRLSLANIPGIEARIEFGEHFSTIINVAETCNADLVVLGKHREDTIRDLFRGSTGERVVRFANRPVLVVKRRPGQDYTRVLVGIDFSPPSARAIQVANEIVPDVETRLVHAFHIPFPGFLHAGKSFNEMAKRQQQSYADAIQDEMAKFFASLGIDMPSHQKILEEGDAGSVILRAVEEHRPDLVVVGTHGRSGLGRALIGSVAERVIIEAPCDVLAVR